MSCTACFRMTMEVKMISVEPLVIGRSFCQPLPPAKNTSSTQSQETQGVNENLLDLVSQLEDMAYNLSLNDAVNSAQNSPCSSPFPPETKVNTAAEETTSPTRVIRGPVKADTQNGVASIRENCNVVGGLPVSLANGKTQNVSGVDKPKETVGEQELVAFFRGFFEQAETRIFSFLQPHIKAPSASEEVKLIKARVHALLCLYLKEAVQRNMLPLFFDAFRSEKKILEFIHLLWAKIRQRQDGLERRSSNPNCVATAKVQDKPRLIDRGIHDRNKTSSQFRYVPYGQTGPGEDRDQYHVRNIVGPMQQICLQPPLAELQAMQCLHGQTRTEPNRILEPIQSELNRTDDKILHDITMLCSEPEVFRDLDDEDSTLDIYNFIQLTSETGIWPEFLARVQQEIEASESQTSSPEHNLNPRTPASPYNPGNENQSIYDQPASFVDSKLKLVSYESNFEQVRMNIPVNMGSLGQHNITGKTHESYKQDRPLSLPSPPTTASSNLPNLLHFHLLAYETSRDTSPFQLKTHPFMVDTFHNVKLPSPEMSNQNSPRTAPYNVYCTDQRSSPVSPVAGVTPLLSPVQSLGGDVYVRSPQAGQIGSPSPPSPEQRSSFVPQRVQNLPNPALSWAPPAPESIVGSLTPFQLPLSGALSFTSATSEIQARLDPIKKENALRAAAKLTNDNLLAPDKDGDTKLMVVCASPKCALEEVYAIVERAKACPSTFEALNQGVTALFMAVQFKRALVAGYVAETMVKLGLDLNRTYGQGNRLIHCFASRGDEYAPCFEYLLRLKTPSGKSAFNLDAENHSGRSALHEAVLTHGLTGPNSISCFRIIELLIKYGANASQSESRGGKSPVHMVVEKRDPELLKHILRCAPEAANAVMYNKNTPLHSAATLREASEKDQLVLVSILLQAGADKRMRNAQKKLPIELVAQDRQQVKGLLQARPKARN